MCFKLKSENTRKFIAVVSTIVSIAFIVRVNGSSFDNLILTHIGLLQLVASILLLIGTVHDNRWFFLPWLVIAFLFAYTLLFLSILFLTVLVEIDSKGEAFMIISLLYTVAGFWFYFIYKVYVDFRDMQTRPINGIV